MSENAEQEEADVNTEASYSDVQIFPQCSECHVVYGDVTNKSFPVFPYTYFDLNGIFPLLICFPEMTA